MDITHIGTKVLDFIKKYRYPILILAVGLVLMCLPGTGDRKKVSEPELAVTEEKTDITEELTRILTQIAGVGKVKVMLTIATGESTIYQTDDDISDTSVRKDTVIITDSDRNEHPLVIQVVPAQYRGAIIVCQGADSAAVKLAVVEAVSRITGLGADCISVLKMK